MVVVVTGNVVVVVAPGSVEVVVGGSVVVVVAGNVVVVVAPGSVEVVVGGSVVVVVAGSVVVVVAGGGIVDVVVVLGVELTTPSTLAPRSALTTLATREPTTREFAPRARRAAGRADPAGEPGTTRDANTLAAHECTERTADGRLGRSDDAVREQLDIARDKDPSTVGHREPGASADAQRRRSV